MASRSEPLHLKQEQAPLLAFKNEYPVLFECLHATFGLMMSNSRLCEQIHGMMRHGLRYQQGMDHVDAQNTYNVRHAYQMRQERSKERSESLGPTSKRRRMDHNATKEQARHLSLQLVERAKSWSQKASALLSRDGHGIPTLAEIHRVGRRAQDKANVEAQVQLEAEKAAKLTREEITPAMVKDEAIQTELSNDRVMQLGDERLALRERLHQLSRADFWKKGISIPEGLGRRAYRYVMKVAWQSFPYWHLVVQRKIGKQKHNLLCKELKSRNVRQSIIRPVSTITETRDLCSKYVARITRTAKNIIGFMYGTAANPLKRTPKRDRTMTFEDVLSIFHLLRESDGATEGEGLDSIPAEVRAISAFTETKDHYTYTLDPDWTPVNNNLPTEEEADGN